MCQKTKASVSHKVRATDIDIKNEADAAGMNFHFWHAARPVGGNYSQNEGVRLPIPEGFLLTAKIAPQGYFVSPKVRFSVENDDHRVPKLGSVCVPIPAVFLFLCFFESQHSTSGEGRSQQLCFLWKNNDHRSPKLGSACPDSRVFFPPPPR